MKVKCYTFIAITSLLTDILPSFTRLSNVFQREALQLLICNHCHGNCKKQLTQFLRYRDTVIKSANLRQDFTALNIEFIDTLKENLNLWFPEKAALALRALDAILNPQKYPFDQNGIAEYGHGQLHVHLDHYAPPDVDFEANEVANTGDRLTCKLNRKCCLGDFLPFKHFTRIHNTMGFTQFLDFLRTTNREDFPGFHCICRGCIDHPLKWYHL